MGDWNQAVLDHEVTTLEQAQTLAAEIVRWLIDERVVEDRLCDGCLGKGACYPPGANFMQACGGVASEHINGNYASFSQMATNGMRVIVGRNAVVNNQGQFQSIACPRCAAQVPIDDYWDAGSDWCEGKIKTMQCRHCRQDSELPRWIHPEMGFVMLAFEFWNWSALSDTFIEAIAQRLGHQVTVVDGKL